jgi:hypothetical protein
VMDCALAAKFRMKQLNATARSLDLLAGLWVRIMMRSSPGRLSRFIIAGMIVL